MDSFELNKIIGAILGTLLFVMGVGFLAEAIYEPIEGRGPGYELPEPEPVVAEGGETEVVATPISVLLASASAADGEASARKCQSCHSFNEGGPNGTGPNLWGVVGRPVASHEGYAYSDAMIAHALVEPIWTYSELNEFLIAPRAHIPGTKMNYAGVKADEERANIIAYLSTLSDAPVPFPEPEEPIGADPAIEGAAPIDLGEPTSEPAETTATESPVVGTPTPTNTPAGAEPNINPAAEPLDVEELAPEEPAMVPAEEPAMAPAAEPLPAPAAETPEVLAPAPPATTTPAPITPAPAATPAPGTPATPQ